MVEVRRATVADALDFSDKLRQSDIDEVWASSGMGPEEALLQSLAMSDLAWVGYEGDTPLGIGGASTLGPRVGVAWFLATDHIYEHRMATLRWTQAIVDALHQEYMTLFNYVDVRHVESMKWLEWLGFEPTEFIEEHGYEGRPFIKYESHIHV